MRHLWIVSREEPQLYEYLRNQFAGRTNVEVIVDRRQGQRRQRAESPGFDRRQANRRQQSIDEDLASLGIAIARLP